MKKNDPLLAQFQANCIEVGCDEAGRGCLAGPVFAGAVIFPMDYYHPLLNDSKKLNRRQRDFLRPIIEKEALSFAVSSVSAEEIDVMNIHQASYLAMHRAISCLAVVPEHILVDGNRFVPYIGIPHTCIIKGDSKFLSIAAASILAKTYRDDYMEKIAQDFPEYDWQSNKGYPTFKHRSAIWELGSSVHHRKSFKVRL